jgi:subtilisin family serine protease
VDTADTVDTVDTLMVKKIVLFHNGVSEQERKQFVSQWEPYGVSTLTDLPFINGMVLSVPETILASDLAGDPLVDSVEEDQKMELQALSAAADGGAADGGAADGGAADGGAADGGAEVASFISPVDGVPNGQRPWGTLNLYDYGYNPYTLTDIYDWTLLSPIIYDAIYSKKLLNIRVAAFDTGVDTRHAALRKKIAGGIDLVNFTEGIPADDNGHGTHVAGTLCGNDLGILPHTPVRLYAVKVLNQYAMGDISTLIMGLQWAINNDMDIVNMSIAFRENNPAVHLAIQKAYEAGIILVAAAGNHSNWDDCAPTASADGGAADGGAADGGAADGGAADGGAADGGAVSDGTSSSESHPVMYPAAYPEVIAVAAMNSFEEIASFSNTGSEIDILAPGTNVVSSDIGGGYGLCSGTSMAAPHVTGAVAMMLARAQDGGKTMTPADAQTILKQSALNGKLNVAGALEEVLYVLP